MGPKSQFLFRVAISECQNCGRNLLSLEKEVNFSECPGCAEGDLHTVVDEKVRDLPFDIPDVAGSFDLLEIWGSCPKENRRMIVEADIADSKFVREKDCEEVGLDFKTYPPLKHNSKEPRKPDLGPKSGR